VVVLVLDSAVAEEMDTPAPRGVVLRAAVTSAIELSLAWNRGHA